MCLGGLLIAAIFGRRILDQPERSEPAAEQRSPESLTEA
jgi:hypothetical protein